MLWLKHILAQFWRSYHWGASGKICACWAPLGGTPPTDNFHMWGYWNVTHWLSVLAGNVLAGNVAWRGCWRPEQNNCRKSYCHLSLYTHLPTALNRSLGINLSSMRPFGLQPCPYQSCTHASAFHWRRSSVRARIHLLRGEGGPNMYLL